MINLLFTSDQFSFNNFLTNCYSLFLKIFKIHCDLASSLTESPNEILSINATSLLVSNGF